mmetsp:Transcript_3381/g.4990  ORF Transcript_3381/g.4990 Transcript_3381/m.4990 type:complete len:351 (+) Transcript_3381:45-1097(+)
MTSRSAKRKARAKRKEYVEGLFNNFYKKEPVIVLPKLKDNFEFSDSDEETNCTLDFSPNIFQIQTKEIFNIETSFTQNLCNDYLLEYQITSNNDRLPEDNKEEYEEETMLWDDYMYFEELHQDKYYKRHAIRLENRQASYSRKTKKIKIKTLKRQKPHHIKKEENKNLNLEYHYERRKLNVSKKMVETIPRTNLNLPGYIRQFLMENMLDLKIKDFINSITKDYNIDSVKYLLKKDWASTFTKASMGIERKFLSYHCTREKNFDSIAKKGFIAGGTKSVKVVNGTALGTGVYTTRKIASALTYANDNKKVYICAVSFDREKDRENSWCHCIKDDFRIVPIAQVRLIDWKK